MSSRQHGNGRQQPIDRPLQQPSSPPVSPLPQPQPHESATTPPTAIPVRANPDSEAAIKTPARPHKLKRLLSMASGARGGQHVKMSHREEIRNRDDGKKENNTDDDPHLRRKKSGGEGESKMTEEEGGQKTKPTRGSKSKRPPARRVLRAVEPYRELTDLESRTTVMHAVFGQTFARWWSKWMFVYWELVTGLVFGTSFTLFLVFPYHRRIYSAMFTSSSSTTTTTHNEAAEHEADTIGSLFSFVWFFSLGFLYLQLTRVSNYALFCLCLRSFDARFLLIETAIFSFSLFGVFCFSNEGLAYSVFTFITITMMMLYDTLFVPLKKRLRMAFTVGFMVFSIVLLLIFTRQYDDMCFYYLDAVDGVLDEQEFIEAVVADLEGDGGSSKWRNVGIVSMTSIAMNTGLNVWIFICRIAVGANRNPHHSVIFQSSVRIDDELIDDVRSPSPPESLTITKKGGELFSNPPEDSKQRQQQQQERPAVTSDDRDSAAPILHHRTPTTTPNPSPSKLGQSAGDTLDNSRADKLSTSGGEYATTPLGAEDEMTERRTSAITTELVLNNDDGHHRRKGSERRNRNDHTAPGGEQSRNGGAGSRLCGGYQEDDDDTELETLLLGGEQEPGLQDNRHTGRVAASENKTMQRRGDLDGDCTEDGVPVPASCVGRKGGEEATKSTKSLEVPLSRPQQSAASTATRPTTSPSMTARIPLVSDAGDNNAGKDGHEKRLSPHGKMKNPTLFQRLGRLLSASAAVSPSSTAVHPVAISEGNSAPTIADTTRKEQVRTLHAIYQARSQKNMGRRRRWRRVIVLTAVVEDKRLSDQESSQTALAALIGKNSAVLRFMKRHRVLTSISGWVSFAYVMVAMVALPLLNISRESRTIYAVAMIICTLHFFFIFLAFINLKLLQMVARKFDCLFIFFTGGLLVFATVGEFCFSPWGICYSVSLAFSVFVCIVYDTYSKGYRRLVRQGFFIGLAVIFGFLFTYKAQLLPEMCIYRLIPSTGQLLNELNPQELKLLASTDVVFNISLGDVYINSGITLSVLIFRILVTIIRRPKECVVFSSPMAINEVIVDMV